MSGSWKVAYADFVTAMMAFFLLMWILAKVPEEKQAALAGYFASGGEIGATGNIISPDPPQSVDSTQPMSPAAQISIEVTQYLRSLLQQRNLQDKIRLTPSEAGVLMRVQSGLMYGENEVVLNEEGYFILDVVALTIKQYKLNLAVRGHADSQESGGIYRSKWEISAVRAALATQYLVEERQISPSLLVSTFYGDSRPIVPDTDGRPSPENRRVEFFFHRPEVAVNVLGGY